MNLCHDRNVSVHVLLFVLRLHLIIIAKLYLQYAICYTLSFGFARRDPGPGSNGTFTEQ